MDIVTLIFVNILYLLLVHWVADFVMQNDQMALNKSTSNYWLGIHVGVYTLATISLWSLFFSIVDLEVSFLKYLEAAAALYVMHFITDYITSRITGRYFRAKKNHEFFVTIGFDAFLHYCQILFVFNFIIL